MNKETQVGKVVVSYDKGDITNLEFSMSIPLQDNVINLQEEIRNKLKSNDKSKLNEAAEYILANVFSNITELELRDFDNTSLETKLFCNEEDGIVTECTIVYYVVEK